MTVFAPLTQTGIHIYWWRVLLAVCLATAAINSASPHELRPAYLELTTTSGSGNTYDMTWKVPVKAGLPLPIEPRFPPDCTIENESQRTRVENSLVVRFSLACETPLTGRTVLFDGLSGTLTDVLIRANWDNETEAARATADTPSIELKGVPSATGAAGTYFLLGLEHILLGFDHLLFVLALLLLSSGLGQLFKTITAFTVAHSLTLGLTATGWTSLPSAPVEAVIALSIVFLAREVLMKLRASENNGHLSLSQRSPWIIAFAFGLLHGFGFAGALQEIGLPSGAVLLALFTFNIGVEAGQILFVAGVLVLAWPLMRMGRAQSLYQPAGYLIGVMATYWLIERLVT